MRKLLSVFSLLFFLAIFSSLSVAAPFPEPDPDDLIPVDVLVGEDIEARYLDTMIIDVSDPVTFFVYQYLDETDRTVADWNDFLMFIYLYDDLTLRATTVDEFNPIERTVWTAVPYAFAGRGHFVFAVDSFWGGSAFQGADYDFQALAEMGGLYVISEESPSALKFSFAVDPSLAAVPEPGTALLLGSGLFLVGGGFRLVSRRKRSR